MHPHWSQTVCLLIDNLALAWLADACCVAVSRQLVAGGCPFSSIHTHRWHAGRDIVPSCTVRDWKLNRKAA